MQDPASEQTPLMRQYWDLKSQAGDALLLFRMGDFYELFGDDAVEAARILEITLTTRDKNKANPIPMAGVPHHSVQGYLQRLLKAGRKVAIGEQVEDPAKVVGKAIVRREVTRIFTPGIQFEAEGFEANYLATASPVPASGKWIVACLDASTGETLVSEPMSEDEVDAELQSNPVRHVLRVTGELERLGRESREGALPERTLIEELPTNYLSLAQAGETLRRQYSLAGLDTFLDSDAKVLALGRLVAYVLRSQKQERLAHLRLPQPLKRPRTMTLGPRTPQHLDLFPQAEGGPNLYSLVNRTRSALGARALKRWMLAPLKATAEIARRQEAVRELSESQAHLSGKLGTELAEIYDLERISGRVNARLANPRDTLALGRSLSALTRIAGLLTHSKAPLLRDLSRELEQTSARLAPLARRITAQQKEEAPLLARDGGIFARGTSAELDRLLTLTEDGERWLVELEAREREATGIPSLKVRYNRVFGYYIEITQAHLKSAPAHYQRKQTTVGAERFFTEELKKFEDEIVHASTRQKALELELFDQLLAAIQDETPAVMEAARLLGELDALLSLSRLTEEPGWVFPKIDDSLTLEIRDGRHPLVDQPVASRGSFVPNDVELSPETRMTLMITGPNMGGKSTVMRQTALILILGQIGAPVPAREARWGAVSSLHTRIGAHDAIARGQSTFMVEMSELASILHHADERSFIVLDEIGRGTSTYDGVSVAWATLEWICREIGARTLFATHYHELTRLAGTLPRLSNAHMAVESPGSPGSGRARGAHELRFLYKLKEGPTAESFGIHVARIAGLPKPVIDRAWKVLEELESHSAEAANGPSSAQLSLFAQAAPPAAREPEPEARPPEPARAEPHPVVLELENANVNDMTPVQALNFVVRLQEISRDAAPSSS